MGEKPRDSNEDHYEEDKIVDMTPEQLSDEVAKKLREAETPQQIKEARALSHKVFEKLGHENNTPRGMEIMKKMADADFERSMKNRKRK